MLSPLGLHFHDIWSRALRDCSRDRGEPALRTTPALLQNSMPPQTPCTACSLPGTLHCLPGTPNPKPFQCHLDRVCPGSCRKRNGLSLELGLLVDSEIDVSTINGNAKVFINKITISINRYLTLSNPVLINRDRLSTWLIVGKLGQGMRCSKCNSNSDVLVCEPQGKVCICMGESVSK